MATELLYATSHLAGDFINPANAVGNTPTTWAGEVNGNVSATSRWAIGDPSEPLTGAATQTIRVYTRKGSNSGDPTAQVNLYENGVLVKSLVATTSVTWTAAQALTGTFTDADITNPANVEVEVIATHTGGNPSQRNSVQVSHIEWTADVTAAAPSFSGGSDAVVTVTVTGGGSGSSGGGTQPSPVSDVTFEASNVSTFSHSVDAGTGSNRVLVVAIRHGVGGTTATHTTPTYNGVAMTAVTPGPELDARAGVQTRRLSVWKLADPAAGSNLLEGGFSAAVSQYSLCALVVGDAADVDLNTVVTAQQQTGTATQIAITTADADSLPYVTVMDDTGDGSPYSPLASTTEVEDHDDFTSTNHGFATGHAAAPSGSSQTLGWTASTSVDFAIAAFEVTPAVAGGIEGGSAVAVVVAAAGAGTKHASGGSAATVSVAAAGQGSKTGLGGAATAVTATATGAGSKGASEGSATAVTVSTSGDGAKTGSGGSATSVSVVVTGDGVASAEGGGGSAVAVTVVSQGAGTKHVSGGSAASVSVAATGGGFATTAGAGGSATQVAVTATGDGTKHAAGGSSTTITVAATGGGSAAEVRSGGSSVTVATSATGDGTKGARGGAVVSVATVTEGSGAKTGAGGDTANVLVEATGGSTRATSGGSDTVVEVAVAGGGRDASVGWWVPNRVAYAADPIEYSASPVDYVEK